MSGSPPVTLQGDSESLLLSTLSATVSLVRIKENKDLACSGFFSSFPVTSSSYNSGTSRDDPLRGRLQPASSLHSEVRTQVLGNVDDFSCPNYSEYCGIETTLLYDMFGEV